MNKAEQFYNYAVKEKDSGNFVEAIQYLMKSLKIQNSKEALNHLGICQMSLGKHEDAEKTFLQAIDRNSAVIETYINLVIIKLSNDQINEAFGYCLALFLKNGKITIDKESVEWKMMANYFMVCINRIGREIGTFNNLHRNIIQTIVEDNDMSHALMAPGIQNYVDGLLNTFLTGKDAKKAEGLLILLNDIVIRDFLRNNVIESLYSEKIFCNVRSNIAKNLIRSFVDPKYQILIRPILISISIQSSNNEFIWFESEEDKKNKKIIHKKILNDISQNKEVQDLFLLALSAFQPISEYKGVSDYLKKLPVEKYGNLKDLITNEVFNRDEEKRIAKTIKNITPIENVISKKVSDQYNENPYPRWVTASTYGEATKTYQESIKNALFPSGIKNIENFGKLKILVAGCGTGRHPISIAGVDEKNEIDAIDLSLSSLSYGKRMAKKIGIKNVNWWVGDILKLDDLEKEYDIIEAAGVLHHMEDSHKGFLNLERLLKPKGLIKLGLYSRAFRKGRLEKMKKIIKTSKYGNDLNSIRNIRKYMVEKKEDPEIEILTHIKDFYSSSGFRDLLLHVQEKDFTIPELKNFFGEKYDFLGFVFSSNNQAKIVGHYNDHYPEDPKRTNLENWEKIEKENPDVFSHMYQFWLQKK